MAKHIARRRGQGATEYLVVLGAVLLVSMVVVQAVGSSTSTAASLKEEQSSTYWSSATPVSISQFKLTADSLSLRLANRLNEKVRITSIVAVDNSGTSRTLYAGSFILGSSEENNLNNIDLRFNDGNPCKGKTTGTGFEIVQLVFNYDLTSGLSGNVQTGGKPLVGKCGQTFDWISFVPPTPASGASAGTNFTINATVIGVPALSEFKLNFNSTNYSIYNDSLVLAYNFEDNLLLGENASVVVDVSNFGNNGTIYDNTVGLWQFNDADGKVAYDGTRNGYNGILYGPTLGLWHFDEGAGNFANDSTSYGNNGTCYNMSGYSGVSPCEWSGGKNGYGLRFDGSNDYVNASGNSFFAPRSFSMAFEAWVNPAATPNEFAVISRGDISISSGGFFMLSLSNSTTLKGSFQANGGVWVYSSPASVPANSWTHLAMVADHSTDTLSFYVNGVFVSSNTSSQSWRTDDVTYSKELLIGGQIDNGVLIRKFNGSIDEVAVYNRSLSASEVLDHYNAGRAKFIEWNSSGKSGSALNFDGQSSYVILPSSARPTGAHTISFWVNPTNWSSSTYPSIFGGLGLGGQTPRGGVALTRNVNWLEYDIYNSTNSSYIAISSLDTRIPVSTWTHVAVSWDGTAAASAMKIYVNGAVQASGAGITGSIDWSGFPNFYVGYGYRQYFNGSIDEFEVINRSLSASEVQAIYNSGRARRDSYNSSGKWGGSMSFDGADDFIDRPSVIDSNRYSIELWVNPKNLTGYHGLYSGNYGRDSLFFSDNLLTFQVEDDSGSARSVSYALSPVVWTHVVAVLDNDSQMFLYVNGSQSRTALSSFVSQRQGRTVFGRARWYTDAYRLYYYNGSIDEARIWNRALSASEIQQQYYSNLQKYDVNKWLFTSNQTLLPSGTNSYYLYARSTDGAIDYSDNRTEVS